MTDDTQHIATVPKSRSEEVRVALSEYEGHDLVDLRIFADLDGGADRRPTKRGVALNVRSLPDLIQALEKARDEAIRRGLIDG